MARKPKAPADKIVIDVGLDGLMDMMDRVGKVRAGRMAKPGGPGCVFPECMCQLPFTKCEREIT